MPASPWMEAARRFRPAEGWLAPGPRLFAPPGVGRAWVADVRAVLTAHPSLRADLEAQAAPRAIRPTPSGWTDPRQWTGCLPAAGLLALVDEDPGRLSAVCDRIPAALAMEDWVPPHHAHSRPLDLSAAAAVGDLALYLDFARALLPAEERRTLCDAIRARGVEPLVAMCRARSAPWTTAHHNWPTVVAGAVGLGALAAWEALPDPAEALVHIVERVATPLSTYPQDGSYPEGPGYWHYGLGECLPFCFALWLASGGEADLFTVPFLRNTGTYALHVRTPDGGCFEVEDGTRRWAAGWMLAVLGRAVGDGAATAAAGASLGTPAGGPALRQALFCTTAPAPQAAPATTMAFFPGTQNAMLRSDWGQDAFFAGLHAGSNGVNHAHLDLGTFTVVAGGERVLGDSGSWSYTLDYFQRSEGGRRWDYEPNTTAGHNAVLVDGAGQVPGDGARCPFHQVELRPEDGLGLFALDLTGAYGGRLRRYVRHFAYMAEGALVVVDEIEAVEPARLAWCGHPLAEPEAVEGGWRWRVGDVVAGLRLLGLRDEEGFVLSEARRRTRYVDRVGHAREYATHAVRAATLHRVQEWTVVAVLTAGHGGVPAVEAAVDGRALEIRTPRRAGRLGWDSGRVGWVG